MLSEQLTPQVFEERLKASRELYEEKFENFDEKLESLDEKYDRWNASLSGEVEDVKECLKETDKRIDDFERSFNKDVSDIKLAQEQGKVAMLVEADKQRVSRTRWMIGTVIAVLSLGVSIIMDILK